MKLWLAKWFAVNTATPNYQLALRAIQKYIPAFAFITTATLIVYYYLSFLRLTPLTQKTENGNDTVFYLTLYATATSLTVFVLSLTGRGKNLWESLALLNILTFSVYTLLGGILYHDPNNTSVLPIAIMLLFISATVYPHLALFVLNAFAVLFVFLIPLFLRQLNEVETMDTFSLKPLIGLYVLASLLAFLLNRYLYVFVSSMATFADIYIEKSEHDKLTGLLNREGFSKVFSPELFSAEQLQGPWGPREGNVEIPSGSGGNWEGRWGQELSQRNRGTNKFRVDQGMVSAKNSSVVRFLRDKVLTNDVYVYFIDVNGLKKINDEHGHGMGDKALLCVAQAIELSIREGEDLCVRWGGDEFLIISSMLLPSEMMNKRIQRFIDENSKRFPFKITVSIGEPEKLDPSNIIETVNESDKKMYKNKNSKK